VAYSKQHYQDNKEQIKEQRKQYYQDNKEQIKEKSKQYRENNKEKILEKSKQYRENNKEKISEKAKQHYQDNKESLKQYYQNNKEQFRKNSRQYYQDNKKQIGERDKEIRQDVAHPYFFKKRLTAIKSNAKYRSLDFDLDAEYLKEIWPEDGKCPALGFSLRMDSIARSPSLDRIDNTKGYTKGNVHWVSNKANRIMSDGTPEEVMKVALFFQRATEERANAG